MGKRISAKQWSFLKDNYSQDISQLYPIEFDVGSSAFATFFKNKKKSGNVKKFSSGYDLISDMIAWSEDNLTGMFYVYRKQTNVNIYNTIIFYFLDESDSVLFALTWK
ncbi:MAG: hypothetical protein HC836_23070 [Richelia sp. RM2_1_2]|nr:hypothetical protein [Richelia sp. RM2_1_2]